MSTAYVQCQVNLTVHGCMHASLLSLTYVGNDREHLLSHSQTANEADNEVGQCKLYTYVYVYTDITSCIAVANSIISLVRKKPESDCQSAAATDLPANQDTPPNSNSKQAMNPCHSYYYKMFS